MKSRKIPITIAIDSELLPLLDRAVYQRQTSRSTFITDLIAERLEDISVSANDEKEQELKQNG